MERRAGEVPLKGGVITVHARPHEIKTVSVKFAAAREYTTGGSCYCAIPSFFCISSERNPWFRDRAAHNIRDCSTIITGKKRTGISRTMPPAAGKTPDIRAFMNQCEELPRLWPFARTRWGKTSLMNTQRTAPCENARKTAVSQGLLPASSRLSCPTARMTGLSSKPPGLSETFP
jgi:hypothetical protein